MATSTHLPPPVMMESTEVRKWVTHMLCWTCAMYFSAAASSENDHGSMNLDSKTAPVPSTLPSRVATIHGIAECLTRRWTSVTRRSVFRSYPVRLSSSVASPSCTMRLPERSSGSASPRFSRHRRINAASSLPMMTRASEPPMKSRRLSLGFVHTLDFTSSSWIKNDVSFGNRDISLSDWMIVIGSYNSKEVKMRPKALTPAQIRAARALLHWSAEDLARESAVGLATIRRAENSQNETSMNVPNDLAVRRALEAAGVEFIDGDGGGPGVRLRKRRRQKTDQL